MTPSALQVLEPVGDAAQVGAEPLGVAGVADHPGLLHPVGLEQAPLVELVQVVGPVGEPARGDLDQPRRHPLRVVVDGGDPGQQVGPPAVQAQPERAAPVGVDTREDGVRRLADRGRGGQFSSALSWPRRQRMPASMKPSSSPSKTVDGLPSS